METISFRQMFDFGSGKLGLGNSTSDEFHPEMVHRIQQNALAGKPESMHLLGLMKYYGHGIVQDYHSGIDYFRRAAMAGHLDAQFALAVVFYNGQGS